MPLGIMALNGKCHLRLLYEVLRGPAADVDDAGLLRHPGDFRALIHVLHDIYERDLLALAPRYA